MINGERIKLMTRLQSYEDNEGKKDFRNAGGYFRSDYVGFEIVKAIICATIAFMIVFAAYIYYDFEQFMTDIYKMDLLAFGASLLKAYAIFVVAYCIVVYVASSVKYGKAKKNLRRYFNNLKLLSSLYNKEKERDE